jgi:hypothetical protein
MTGMKRPEGQAEIAEPDKLEGWDPGTIDHDDSLILWMLELSPTKRLAVAQGFVDSVRVLRSGRRAPVSRHS